MYPPNRGPSVGILRFQQQKSPTLFIAVTWPPGKKVFPLRLTLPPTEATTPITAVGDISKAGVAIDTVEDMKVLFDQIRLIKCRFR
ncbi:methylmalonyl-CoA mutase family protein [Escherichia coli]